MGCLKLEILNQQYENSGLKVGFVSKNPRPKRTLKNAYRGYLFGFNGQEKDNEVKGIGNSLDFEFRIYDSRLGKFLSIDPLTQDYPWYTPYQFAGNTPIQAIDIEGAEELIVTDKAQAFYGTTMLVMKNDKILKSLLSEISRPDRKARQLVYLTVGNTSGKGATFGNRANIKAQAVFLANYSTLIKSKKFAKYDLQKKADLISRYEKWSGYFENWGIDYNDVAKAKQTEVFVVVVNEYNSEKYLRGAIKTAVHEMDLHLKNDLNGVNKSQEQEHSEGYGIPLGSQEDRKHGLSQGLSPDNSYVKPNSRMGRLHRAVDRGINKVIRKMFFNGKKKKE